jgi:hypothetical protein
MMYDVVVRLVCVKCFQTYADEKCSEDFHVLVAEEEYCNMQLVIEQCVKLHDSNAKLVIAIQQQRSCNEFDPLDTGSSQTILSMDIWDRVLNFNPQGHASH